MPKYRRHAFEKDWHDKVEEFISENDLAFDSPKYFIKFCVNKYMDEYSSAKIDNITKETDGSDLIEALKEQGYLGGFDSED